MSQIEQGDILTKEIWEIISHAVIIPNIIYALLLGEYVLWIPMLGSMVISFCYHMCQLGLLFSPKLLVTLHRGDYVGISSMVIAWSLRFMNLTWKPRRKDQSNESYYKEMFENMAFSLGVVLCFQVVNNLTTWIIFDTLAGTMVTFGTVLLLFYIVYVQNQERYRLDGYWIFLIDILFAAVGVALLFYAGNPGDFRYQPWHIAWHFVIDFFEYLFVIYIRVRDRLPVLPPLLMSFYLYLIGEENSNKKKQ